MTNQAKIEAIQTLIRDHQIDGEAHLVFEDCNVRDEDIDFYLNRHGAAQSEMTLILLRLFRELSVPEREWVLETMWGRP